MDEILKFAQLLEDVDQSFDAEEVADLLVALAEGTSAAALFKDLGLEAYKSGI